MATNAIIQQKLRQYPTYKSLANAFTHVLTHDKTAIMEQQLTNTITNNHIIQHNTVGILANDDNVDQHIKTNIKLDDGITVYKDNEDQPTDQQFAFTTEMKMVGKLLKLLKSWSISNDGF